MRERNTIVYRGANLSGATANVAHIPILTPYGQIIAATVNVKTNVSGANAVFAVRKNGAVVNDLYVTIFIGSSIGVVSGTAENITQGDDIVLDLVSGAVESPVAFSILVDDGEATVPEGGTADQILAKVSADDYDVEWRNGTSINVQGFTANGTWTKPTGAKEVRVFLIGAGGGGGSGRKGAASTTRDGGGGGGGGSVAEQRFLAADLSGTVAVTIGAGGAGGAGVSANSTSGNVGTAGTATTFGAYLKATGANHGLGGAVGGSGSGAGSGQSNGTATVVGFPTPHHDGSKGGSSQINQTPAATKISPSGGGGGGSISSGNLASGSNGAGGSIGDGLSGIATPVTGGIAGVAEGASGGAGQTSGAKTGTGGGGGRGSLTGAGGAGGVGGSYGGGGGGGGAAVDSVGNSGAGGNGAPGYALIVTYF